MVDVTAAFTAGLVSSLANDSLLGERCSGSNLPKAIKKGLNSARELVSEGFCAEPNETPHYPLSQIMNDQEEHYKIASVLIPLENSTTVRWSIFLNVMGDTMEIARFIVQNGPDDVLSQVQTARFGKLLTADRREMEGFRAITNLVEEYIRGQQIEPLSIGIFGPPGSGKSFAVTQVIEGASHTAKIEELPFNLSQFNHYSDLLSAFQLIRDETSLARCLWHYLTNLMLSLSPRASAGCDTSSHQCKMADSWTTARCIIRLAAIYLSSLELRSINCYMVQKSPVEVLTLREEEIQTLARQDYERHIAEKLVKACGNADLPQKLEIVPPSWNDDREHDTRLIFKSLVKYIPQILGQCDRQVYRLYQGAPITSNIAHNKH
ncbi:hypothetical protein BDV23DRAFT_183254 [Aspergillus alliaceus]|uniref:ATPase AAA-type core domain-containing protein n=1 Tax=Petromyces alliaceus TaxID=209559 RepID=A0A5N7C9D5_PETAA|nr:hypothetical protein BDV23DRAFT_183254 [Aspergillus alliaceus]